MGITRPANFTSGDGIIGCPVYPASPIEPLGFKPKWPSLNLKSSKLIEKLGQKGGKCFVEKLEFLLEPVVSLKRVSLVRIAGTWVQAPPATPLLQTALPSPGELPHTSPSNLCKYPVAHPLHESREGPSLNLFPIHLSPQFCPMASS